MGGEPSEVHQGAAQSHVSSRSWLGPGNRITSSASTVDACITCTEPASTDVAESCEPARGCENLLQTMTAGDVV